MSKAATLVTACSVLSLALTTHGGDISKEQLLLLVEAQRESIADIQIQYAITLSHSNGVQEQHARFAMAGPCAYLKLEYRDENMKNQVSGMCRNRSAYLNYSGTPNEYVSGMIASVRDDIQGIYQGGVSPMGAYMLIDTKKDLGMEILPYDLAAMLRDELTRVTAEGEHVVVSCGDPVLFRVMLDPKKNYAVTRFEEYRNREEGGKASHELRTFTAFSDFYHAGEGMWFAKKIYREYYDIHSKDGVLDKTLQSKVAINVAELTLNGGIDDKEFEDFFPEGAHVNDSVAGVTYVKGGDMSVDGVILSSIKAYKDGAADRTPDAQAPVGAQTSHVNGDRNGGSKSGANAAGTPLPPGGAGVKARYLAVVLAVVVAGCVVGIVFLRKNGCRKET